MSKYTPEIIKEICGHIVDTFHTWRNTKPEFSEAVEAARIKNKQFHIDKITQAKTWQASAWYLERVYREEFGIKKEDKQPNLTVLWEEIKQPKKVG